MSDFPLHSIDTAPEASHSLLQDVQRQFTFLPNLHAVMAGSPALLEAYMTISELFGSSSLTPVEQDVVLLTVSHGNGCDYCVAAHSVGADMSTTPAEVVDAIRDGRVIAEDKLEALRHFTAQLVNRRGWVEQQDIDALLQAGYTRQTMLDIIVGVGMKTLSNYTNHIAQTPLDDAFASRRWSKKKPPSSEAVAPERKR